MAEGTDDSATEPESPIRVEDVAGRLRELGVDRHEADLYVHLCLLGRTKASELAAASGLQRTKTYRTLESMVQKGYARSTLERPTQYEATEPETVFEQLRRERARRLEAVDDVAHEVLPALQTLRAREGVDLSKNTFKVIQGRRDTYRELERMLEGAQRSITTVTLHEQALRIAELAGALETAVELARQGVVVRAVLRHTPRIVQEAGRLAASENVEVRTVDADRMVRFVVVDEAELLIWVASDPSTRMATEDDVAIWTDAKDFVATELALFDELWARGKPVAD